jgi:4-amino-4-deoxy-L-arabinose transferase and related glycosyltransferases of PMT family
MKADVLEKVSSNAPRAVRSPSQWVCPVLVVAVFAALLGVWHSLDHTLPAPDDASYIMGSFKYADLLSHPKIWKADWWYSMLTVNRVYPPTTMLVNGILRVFFGFGNWVNVLSVVLFNGLLTATVFGTTRLLTSCSCAAILAAVLINLYPQTSYMFHGFALDAPLLSMISCGLFVLMWWRSAPSWRRTVVCGFVLGLCCLSKQIAAAYLIVPGLLCLVEALLSDKRSGQLLRSPQVALIGVLTVCTGLPWLVINVPYIKNLATDNQSVMGTITVAEIFPQHLTFYITTLPSIMTPLLLGAFLVSLAVIGKDGNRRLLPLALSAVTGVILLSTLTWSFPSLRYNAPVLIATACYTGYAMSILLRRPLSAFLVWVVLLLGSLQFLSFNFAPYPLSKPEFVARFSEGMGVTLLEKFGLTERDKRVMKVVHSTPNPERDWGQEWALNTIDRVEGRKEVYLNILPDYVQLNGNTFELLGKMIGSPVRPTTARRWTVMGDVIKFDPKTAMYCQWYLLKTGSQGNLFRDEESERNYEKLIDFVKTGGNYKLVDTHPLPDGSTMSLYRQTASGN